MKLTIKNAVDEWLKWDKVIHYIIYIKVIQVINKIVT